MVNDIDLRLEYSSLLREGKKKEALKVLKAIWKGNKVAQSSWDKPKSSKKKIKPNKLIKKKSSKKDYKNDKK